MKHMTRQSIFSYINSMRSDLNKMETGGYVDSSFTMKIDKLDSEFTRMKQYWVDQKWVPVRSAFMFYMAMHNAKLILGKMKERFEKADKNRDNPAIACDSRLVMPIISEVYQKTARATEEKEKLSPFLPNEMLKLVSMLRTTARLVNLLPTLAEEVKKTDKDQLREAAVELDKKFVASNILSDI